MSQHFRGGNIITTLALLVLLRSWYLLFFLYAEDKIDIILLYVDVSNKPDYCDYFILKFSCFQIPDFIPSKR